ncbi:MAG: hypothetical protein AAF430_20185 [Myxococcota bacterium]
MRQKTPVMLGVLLASLGFSTAASAVLTEVPAGTIAGSETWCDDEDTMLLQGPVVVTGSLTIEAGCIVRGQPRDIPFNTPDPGAPGSLQIFRGGTLTAVGTPSSPIIFTTAAVDTDDDGVPEMTGGSPSLPRKWVLADGEGNFLDDTPATNPLAPLNTAGDANVRLWGGITVAGFAPTNLANDLGFGTGIGRVEGTAGQLYGGSTPGDDSGDLAYISLRHAGDEIGAGNELNGITFAGVGSGTTCDHIEIYANQDDGIEWFGGTNDCTNVLLAYIGDDSLDTDQGYTGAIQNAIVLSPFFEEDDSDDYGAASGDRGGELDGDDSPNVVASPVPDVSICNLTIFGNGDVDGGTNPAVVDEAGNRGFTMRNGFGGTVANSIIVNTTNSLGGADAVNVTGGGAIPPCSGVPTPGDRVCGAACGVVGGDEGIEIVALTVSDSPAVNSCGLEAFATGDARVGVGPNIETSAEQLVNEGPFWDPKGTVSNGRGKLMGTLATALNPTPISLATDGVDPTLVGCPDATATYRGAVGTGGVFSDGWSAMSVGGILPEPGAAPSLAAGALLVLGLLRRRNRS